MIHTMAFFKDCIGALDGAHMPGNVEPFKGKKAETTMYVLAIFNFSMRLIYTYLGIHGEHMIQRCLHVVLRKKLLCLLLSIIRFFFFLRRDFFERPKPTIKPSHITRNIFLQLGYKLTDSMVIS